MSDAHLRSLARSAQQSDPEEIAREISLRVRAGILPRNHVLYAAHLGDPLAQTMENTSRIVIDCSTCQWRRDERVSRVRDRQPTPLRETPRQCQRCNGSERIVLDKGLIGFVQQVQDVPHKLLIAWAADCAERQLDRLSPRNPFAFQGRYQLPNQPARDPDLERYIIPAIREWVATDKISALIYQRAVVNVSPSASMSTAAALASAVALANMTDQARKVRLHVACVASQAYHAAGGTRDERTWQEMSLIQYLLGYCAPG